MADGLPVDVRPEGLKEFLELRVGSGAKAKQHDTGRGEPFPKYKLTEVFVLSKQDPVFVCGNPKNLLIRFSLRDLSDSNHVMSRSAKPSHKGRADILRPRATSSRPRKPKDCFIQRQVRGRIGLGSLNVLTRQVRIGSQKVLDGPTIAQLPKDHFNRQSGSLDHWFPNHHVGTLLDIVSPVHGKSPQDHNTGYLVPEGMAKIPGDSQGGQLGCIPISSEPCHPGLVHDYAGLAVTAGG
jgi:hypothetical protein